MDIGVGRSPVSLADRYLELDAPVLLNGTQALVRVLLEQSRLDRANGHRTSGFVSGYRGSPLGGVDQELWRQKKLLAAHAIRFEPGLNEDLAATMVWGTQQVDCFPGKRVEGVFGMWYGKGPGVDRSGDALRCANTLGTSALGGVLAVAGDDHAAQSSVFPHQTEHVFEAAMIPILVPGSVQEILDYGLAGISMSRFCGLWVALKGATEVVESGGTVIVPSYPRVRTPVGHAMPPHGLNLDPHLSWPAERVELERRLVMERLPAVAEFVRANNLDRDIGPADASIGLVTVGKAHGDTLHALKRLGLDRDPRIAIRKVALSWPLEADGLRRFADGKRALLVIEEKRSFVEQQARAALYNMPADRRPMLAGKTGPDDAPLLPAVLELSPGIVARALARFLEPLGVAVDAPPPDMPMRQEGTLARAPYFCAGCPHGTSTRLPGGAHASAGIGCHIMALDNEGTRTFSQMGGEGVSWVGLHSFIDLPHLSANMGDGTYQHSGLLAIRQAVAAEAPITYKILFNDAVAMTGGQPAEGHLTVPMIAAQVAAEGVSRIAVVADEAARLPAPAALPPGTTLHTREALEDVQRDLAAHPGVSVLIYDQVCATEKRRRRKRGRMVVPERAVTITESVCENCGDCSAQSHCIAIEPVETDHGRKRRISPTACNTDLSCLKGFCPSFVTVASRAQAPSDTWHAREAELGAGLPMPEIAAPRAPWRGLFAGIGGGGIVTTGAMVALAAHLDERAVRTLDFTGLAQKNGAVVSHVQIAPDRAALDVARIGEHEADLLLAADLAVAAGPDVLRRCRADGVAVGNLDLVAGAGFVTNPDLRVDAGLHRRALSRRVGNGAYLRAATLSERLFGSAQYLNTLMLGLAWQRGLVPVSLQSLDQAMELNGAAVETNRRAFLWGRILAEHPEAEAEVLHGATPPARDLKTLIAARTGELAAYQDRAYADRYRAAIDRVAAREAEVAGTAGTLTRAAAEALFRVMAYKDEYEVARLHAAAGHDPAAKPVFHMAPPLITRTDPATGRRRKIGVPGWLALPLFRLLRHGKRLRGTAFDPFGRQSDRVLERRLVEETFADIDRMLDTLTPATLPRAVALMEIVAGIRGFGPVKHASYAAAQEKRAALDVPVAQAA